MNCFEITRQPTKTPPNYVIAAIARRHRVSIPAAGLIAELLGKTPITDDWSPLAATANAIVGRIAHSTRGGECA